MSEQTVEEAFEAALAWVPEMGTSLLPLLGSFEAAVVRRERERIVSFLERLRDIADDTYPSVSLGQIELSIDRALADYREELM